MHVPRTGELTLPAATSSVPEARRFVRTTLRSWELEDQADAAALVVSELATNAVLHARTTFTVRLLLDADGRLRLEVTDGSKRRPDRRSHSADAATGRGLAIVTELALAWGVEEKEQGKTVWAELTGPAGDTAALGSAGSGPAAPRAGRHRPDPQGTQVAA